MPPRPPPPQASPAHQAPWQPWRRTARLERGEQDIAPGGAAELLIRCGDRQPCVAERYLPPEGGPARWLLRAGDQVEFDGQPTWPGRWTSVSGPLRLCLGDPLQATPAGDPAGLRQLERQGDRWRWRLSLAGHNPCGLQGTVLLDAARDHADARQLSCDGLAWLDGGRRACLERLRAMLRAEAQMVWHSLDPGERQLWLDVLEEDPQATTLIEELERAE